MNTYNTKNQLKKMKKTIALLTCLLISVFVNAQDIQVNNYKVSTAAEIKTFESSLTKNKVWSQLMALATQKGYIPVNAAQAKFGFTGEWENLTTKTKSPARFFIIDLWNPKNKLGQGASLVYRQANGQTYIALCEFPVGVTNGTTALDSCIETTVENGKLVPAKSWSRCFRRCAGGQPGKVIVDVKGGTFSVPGGCGTGCLGSIAVCGGVTAILTVATGGAAFFPAAITFGICAGVSCGVCFAVCALGCM